MLILLKAGHLHRQDLRSDQEKLVIQLPQVGDLNKLLSPGCPEYSRLTGTESSSPWSMKKQVEESPAVDNTFTAKLVIIRN